MYDSYHDIWMELHHDLLPTAGRERGAHDECRSFPSFPDEGELPWPDEGASSTSKDPANGRCVFCRGRHIDDVTTEPDLKPVIEHSAPRYTISATHPDLAVGELGNERLEIATPATCATGYLAKLARLARPFRGRATDLPAGCKTRGSPTEARWSGLSAAPCGWRRRAGSSHH